MSGSGVGTSDAGQPGYQYPEDDSSEFNKISFIVTQALRLVNSATLVQVKKVTNNGEVQSPTLVDVLPLVNLIDGMGKSQKHDIVHDLPYFRLQGGTNAIICDPKVGDIGIAVFADRDISSVKKNKAQSNPGSWRRFDLADGMYFGSVLGAVPVQYLDFNENGITIADKNGNTITMDDNGVEIDDTNGNTVTMDSDGIELDDLNGNTIVMDSDGVKINGVLIDQSQNISNAGTVDATGEGTFNGHTVGAHHHGGVQSGSSNTDPPTG